jgi:hypothetical protein
MRRRWPSLGSAIQCAPWRIWSTLSPVIAAASSRLVRLAASASASPAVCASMNSRSSQPCSAI